MVEKNNPHLDYQRYAARAGIPIITPKQQADTPKEELSAENSSPEPPKLTPYQIFKMAGEKIENTPLTRENVDEYVKMLNEFVRLGYELEEYEIIINVMKKYLVKNPRDNGIRQNLANVLLKIGQVKKCKIELRTIMKNDPKYKPARELLEKFRRGEN